MSEVNLLDKYPQRKRDISERIAYRTPDNLRRAAKFDWEYFDMKGCCYDGYIYDGRWIPIADNIIKQYSLNPGDKVLDIGCAKGYLVYELRRKGIDACGIDISQYAIDCAPTPVKPYVSVGDARDLSCYISNSFDFVISLTTLPVLSEDEIGKALIEMQRISRGKTYATFDTYETNEEKEKMLLWTLTAKTVKSKKEFIKWFKYIGWNGDYWWFVP